MLNACHTFQSLPPDILAEFLVNKKDLPNAHSCTQLNVAQWKMTHRLCMNVNLGFSGRRETCDKLWAQYYILWRQALKHCFATALPSIRKNKWNKFKIDFALLFLFVPTLFRLCVDVSLGLAAPTSTCRCDIGSVVRPVNSCLLHVLAAAQQSFLLSSPPVIHKLDPNLYMLCLLPFSSAFTRESISFYVPLFFSPLFFFLATQIQFPLALGCLRDPSEGIRKRKEMTRRETILGNLLMHFTTYSLGWAR